MIVLPFFQLSCKKTIDLNPTHTLDGDVAFKQISDYEAALTGAYSRLLSVNYYGSSNGSNAFATLSDMMTDNLFESGESLGNYQSFSHWTYTADEPNIEATWLAAYRVIQQANLTLRNIDALSADAPGAVNRIKAQALALSGFVHFDILRYWGEGSQRNSTLKGIPYSSSFDIEQKPARLSVKASYDAIINDLMQAKLLMQNMDKPIQSATSTASTARGYVDEIATNAMLARIYNYAAEPDSAIKYASLAIAARPLASRTNFPLVWQDASTADVIWSVKFTPLNSGTGDNVYYATGNRASYRPATNLLSLYDVSNDIRYTSFFQVRPRGSSSRLVLTKYLAKQSQLATPDGITDFKVLRTGEMYLIRAEAYANKGLDGLALADLNSLRAARINGFIAGTETGAALVTAIFNERRKELVAEGHRWFDLKRTTRVVNRTTNCSVFCTLGSTAREWAWPIPQSEILANKNIEQTTGY
ncbi:MAG: RagB/SusD family nutrient uptake outer membrane protein [Ferruginibacter sp.]|nr:RagB/SusD family nutrient uptake outer membrane protein [Ferruginibacter sp.]